jgi:hypothetical protein
VLKQILNGRIAKHNTCLERIIIRRQTFIKLNTLCSALARKRTRNTCARAAYSLLSKAFLHYHFSRVLTPRSEDKYSPRPCGARSDKNERNKQALGISPRRALVFWPLSVSLVERSVLIAKMTRDVPKHKRNPRKVAAI